MIRDFKQNPRLKLNHTPFWMPTLTVAHTTDIYTQSILLRVHGRCVDPTQTSQCGHTEPHTHPQMMKFRTHGRSCTCGCRKYNTGLSQSHLEEKTSQILHQLPGSTLTDSACHGCVQTVFLCNERFLPGCQTHSLPVLLVNEVI